MYRQDGENLPHMNRLLITYRLKVDEADPAAMVDSILVEQTVETPTSVALRYPFVREEMLGSVEGVEADGADGFLVTLALPIINAAVDTAQFFNVLFGNVSLHDSVSLVSVALPAALARKFAGPKEGIAGLRERAGVPRRPLTLTALKPVGLTVAQLQDLCHRLALGGIDLIKDDHYLSDHAFCPFEDRVVACLDACRRAADVTGRTSLYCPNLSGSPEEVLRQAEFAQEMGAEVMMCAPMLLGLPFFEKLASSYTDVPLLAHPAFSGSIRIAPDLLIGRIFRMLGADAVIFANSGGRFGTPPDVSSAIAEEARAPWFNFAPALPVPAGGMRTDQVPALVERFGPDTGLLIGGSLLEANDSLTEHARAFSEAVESAARTYGSLPDIPS